jgi:hypothetical protein
MEVDDSTWPLLVLSFPRIAEAGTLRAFIEAFERAYERETPFATVIDGTMTARFPGPQGRKMLVEWLGDARRAELERLWCVGSAVVLPSGPKRALVSAFNIVRRPAAPQYWTATLPEAVDWARTRLLDAGVSVTPRIDELHADLHAQTATRVRRPT